MIRRLSAQHRATRRKNASSCRNSPGRPCVRRGGAGRRSEIPALGQPGDILTFDPHAQNEGLNNTATGYVYESLLTYNENSNWCRRSRPPGTGTAR